MNERTSVKAKVLSIIVALTLMVGSIPSFAFADEENLTTPATGEESSAVDEGATVEDEEGTTPEDEVTAPDDETVPPVEDEEETEAPEEDAEEEGLPEDEEPVEGEEPVEEAVEEEDTEDNPLFFTGDAEDEKFSSLVIEELEGIDALSGDMEAMAAGPSLIYVGGTCVYNNGVVKSMPAGMSYNNAGTLTLNNYLGNEELIYYGGSLTINVVGKNAVKLIEPYTYSEQGKITIKGNGTLNCHLINLINYTGSLTLNNATVNAGGVRVGSIGKVFTMNSGVLNIDSAKNSYLKSSSSFSGITTRSGSRDNVPVMNFLGGRVSIVDKRKASESAGIVCAYGNINIKNSAIRIELKATRNYGIAVGSPDTKWNPTKYFGGNAVVENSRVAVKTTNKQATKANQDTGLAFYAGTLKVNGKAYYYAGNGTLNDSTFNKAFPKNTIFKIKRNECKYQNFLIDKAAYAPIKRLAGAHRYATMSSILKTGFKKSGTVIIATGENYPDALAASGLAGLNNAPIILTSKASLTPEAKAEIQRLGAKKAYIIGSNAAVSSKVEKTLKGMKVSVTRLAGSNRTETAVKIYQAGKKVGKGWSKTAIIASGTGFADALSISSYSFAKKSPIFLAGGDKKLTKDTLNAIKSGKFTKVIIVGGDAAVSSSVNKQLTGIGIKSNAISRWAGSDRYETSLVIAKNVVASGMKVDKMAVATGANFPDALAGAALCGKNNSVVLLVADNSVVKGYVNSFVTPNRTKIKSVYALGSATVVSNSMTNYIRGCLL